MSPSSASRSLAAFAAGAVVQPAAIERLLADAELEKDALCEVARVARLRQEASVSWVPARVGGFAR